MRDYTYIFKHELEDRHFTSGANLLVLKDGKEICYSQYGYRDLKNKTPFSRDTIFRLYSMTKPITAAAAMILVDRGQIDLADCLCWFMPGFKPGYTYQNGVRVKTEAEITIKDLLNMTSGIPYPGGDKAGGQVAGVFWEIGERNKSGHPMTTLEFSEKIGACDLSFEPGERFMYGASADVLGAVIERVSGVRFSKFLKSEIFDPLGMTDTDFWVPEEKQHRLAKIYTTDYQKWCVSEVMTNEHLAVSFAMDKLPAFESGGAGLCSTLDDYAKFAAMLLNGGELNGRRILSKSAVKYLTSPSLTPWQMEDFNRHWRSLTGYSYGNLMRNCVNPGTAHQLCEAGEYGWDGWLGCYFANCPQSGLTILLGMQRVNSGTSALTRKLINAVRSDLGV